MAQRRDAGFSPILSQLRPLAWLAGLSIVILLISLAILSITYESEAEAQSFFELRADEALIEGEDFAIAAYSQKSARKSIHEEYVDRLDSNLDIVQMIQVEDLKPNRHFLKGYILRFSIPSDEDREIDRRQLRLGYFSESSKKWIPVAAPFSSKEGVVYEYKDSRYGWFGMGIYRHEEVDDSSKSDSKPKETEPESAKVEEPKVKQDLSKTTSCSLRGAGGEGPLENSAYLTLKLSGLCENGSSTAKAFVGAEVSASILGKAEVLGKVIHKALEIRWYLTSDDLENDIPEDTHLIGERIWTFGAIPTHRAAEWLVTFQIVDVSDGKVYARGQMPLSVREP